MFRNSAAGSTRRIRSVHVVAAGAIVLAMSGGATAAAVITGKQIKDNSVSSKDIKNGSLQVKDFKASEASKLRGPAGANGTNGTNGANGAAGASAFAPPPSGTTISGGGMITSEVSAAGVTLRSYSPLPFTAAAPFTDGNLFFGGSQVATAPSDRSVTCTGTLEVPTAPAGVLCAYVSGTPENVAAGSANVAPGTLGGPDGADRNGFFIFASSAAAGEMVFRYVWAYTAP